MRPLLLVAAVGVWLAAAAPVAGNLAAHALGAALVAVGRRLRARGVARWGG